MYIYIENDYFIPLEEIIAVVDAEKFFESKNSEEFLQKNRNKIINLAKKEKKTVIITDQFIYLTTYTARALYSRGMEFEKIKKNGRLIDVE